MKKTRRAIFVSIAKPLPTDLVPSLLDALQLDGIEPFVYHGVPKPAGQIVTSVFVEARDELLASDAAFLILATDGSGQISDDWSLSFLPELQRNRVPVFVYLIVSSGVGKEPVAQSTLDRETIRLKILANIGDVTATVTADAISQFGSTSQ
jgi:hypothetical protein